MSQVSPGMLCMYCQHPAKLDGWVDTIGVGWGPNCWESPCEYKADQHAWKQRLAIKQHNSTAEAQYVLYVPSWYDPRRDAFEIARDPRYRP